MKTRRSYLTRILAVLALTAIFLQAGNASAIVCQKESSTWTELLSCTADSGRGWGAIVRVPPFASSKTIYAWVLNNAPGHIAVATALNSSGGVISACVASDTTYDLYPVGDGVGCNSGVRVRLTVSR